MPPREYPFETFNRLFSNRNVKATFDGHLSNKAARGLDRIGINTFNKIKKEQFRLISKKCNRGTYKFTPYVEQLHSKGRGKAPRIISIATIRDRIVLSLLKDLLHSVFPECVNRKLPNSYIREIKSFYDSQSGPHLCYYKCDIKGFYDNIDREILMKAIKRNVRSRRILSLLESSINNHTVPSHYKYKDKNNYITNIGIPQGLAASNILANIYLRNFDAEASSLGFTYFRYVDDIFIFTDENKKDTVQAQIKHKLATLKLELSEDKTCCELTSCPVDYLGYRLALPIVSIRESNVERFIKSVAAKFTAFGNNSDYYLKKHGWLTRDIQKQVFIEDINEKITGAISDGRRYGWLMYFLEITDMQLLHKLDNIIRGFFTRLKDFGHVHPPQLKKLSTAFYKAKHDILGGYIHNYQLYDSVPKKARYLSERGLLNPKGLYRKEEIEILFARIKKKNLSRLDLDVGLVS